MHALEISRREAQREKSEDTAADLAVVPSIRHDDNQVRRDNHVRRDFMDRAPQSPKALRIDVRNRRGLRRKAAADLDLNAKIGRASCRERGEGGEIGRAWSL